MLAFVIRRLLQTIPVLIGVTIVVFFIIHLIPGDPAMMLAGEGASPERIDLIRHQLGLDQPLLFQYFTYLGHVVHGNFGISLWTNRPVIDEILSRLPTTMELALAGTLITVFLGLLFGMISATKQNSVWDILLMIVALLGISAPSFWIGLMLIYAFSVKIHIFPVAGWGSLMHVFLPAITLGVGGAAIVARMTRSSMLDVIRQDYIRTAKAKGVKSQVIVYKHALRNALIPVITVIGLEFGALLGGAVLTETIFAINGVGRLIVNAINQRDFALVQGTVLLISVIFVVVNLLVDILCFYFNKRIELN